MDIDFDSKFFMATCSLLQGGKKEKRIESSTIALTPLLADGKQKLVYAYCKNWLSIS